MNSELERLEKLIVVAFSSPDPNERSSATTHISKFTEVDSWQHNLTLLKQSKNQFALHFAALNIRNAVTDFPTSFSTQQLLELRQSLLAILADLGTTFWGNNTVKPVLVECFCRLQKLCWFDSESTSTLISDIMPFLQHSIAHSIIGINLFQQLVYEVSQNTEKFSYTKQRKIAVAFREQCLEKIFHLGLASVARILQSDRKSLDQNQQSLLIKESLDLVIQVLSYDFIGIAPDPSSSDDVGVIHIPENWATHFQDNDPLSLFFRVYDEFGPPHSTQCLVVLESLAGVRNSLFTSVDSRTHFLNTLVDGVGQILTTKKDLDNEQNRHHLSRLLVRLKGNYQLKHLLETKHFLAFVHKLVEFSMSLFQSNSFSTIYYVMAFWSHIIGAHCQTKSDKSSILNEVGITILNGFLTAQIERASQITDPNEESLGSEHLHSILGELQNITKCGYSAVVALLLSALRTIVQHRFQPILKLHKNEPSVVIAEKQLSWTIYIVSSVIGGMTRGIVFDTEQNKQEVQQIEAQIITSIFECLSLHDARIQEKGLTNATSYLELAFIFFLQKFCKVYLIEPSPSHAIIYDMLGQQLHLGAPDRLIERIVSKVVMLLNMWPQHGEIIDQTTGPEGLFWQLATGFSASRLMGKSPVVSHILEHHLELDVGTSRRSREAFYKTLGCLLFSPNNKTTDFYTFVCPIKRRIDQIKATLQSPSSTSQSEQVFRALNRVLSDMRGFVSSITSKDRRYHVFFDWFYHETGYYEWLVQLFLQSHQFGFQSETIWSIILFTEEFTNNSQRRINFDVTSADGIKLFRTTARLLIHFAGYIMSPQHPPELDDKYKSIKLFLRCLEHCLMGGYTNFGVFEMYNDSILNDLLTISCNIIFSLDSVHLDLYPKVLMLVFTMIENLTKDHCEHLISMDSNLFGKLLKFILLGLHSKAKIVISSCCGSLDKIFSLHNTNLLKVQQTYLSRTVHTHLVECMNKHIFTHQTLLNSMLLQLLNLTLTIDGVHWVASKPLFALIILLPKEFANIQQLLVNSQAHDESKAKRTVDICCHLMDGVTPHLTVENRDKFTANVTKFRFEMKNFIDLNAFYKATLSYNQE